LTNEVRVPVGKGRKRQEPTGEVGGSSRLGKRLTKERGTKEKALTAPGSKRGGEKGPKRRVVVEGCSKTRQQRKDLYERPSGPLQTVQKRDSHRGSRGSETTNQLLTRWRLGMP